MTSDERKLLSLLILTFIHETVRLTRRGPKTREVYFGIKHIYSMFPSVEIFYKELQTLKKELTAEQDTTSDEWYVTVHGAFLFERLSPTVPPPRNEGMQIMQSNKTSTKRSNR